MKKKDLAIVVALIALWMAWPWVDRKIIKPLFPARPPAPAVVSEPEPAAESGPALGDEPAAVEAVPAEADAAAEITPAEAAGGDEAASEGPGRDFVIENDSVRITLTSRGAAVRSVELKEYRESLDPQSGPVVLGFSDSFALAYRGLKGLSDAYDFQAAPDAGGRGVAFERATAAGLRLRRTITLEDTGYLVRVRDEFVNESAQPLTLPVHSLQTGPMVSLPGETEAKGVVYLGVDSLSPGGERVKYWGKDVPKWFSSVREDKGLPKLPVTIDWPIDKPVDWVAAKSKYFVQILTPEGGADAAGVFARRKVTPAEAEDPGFKPKSAAVEQVSIAVRLASIPIEQGGTFVRSVQYYAGPKKYSVLNAFGLHQVDVMEFGMWAPVGKLLLQIMNGIYAWLWPHNYGIAIILLTILVRIVFWPVTHKSTESMKRMQEIQPLVNAVREKYKDNAQKQQQEIMRIYKENKVNPLGGCLPMLIQIPVFIALFVVLRSAIELRFAPFLWIRDLSQPENLLAGVLPIPLNILPLFMAVTMAWQQKLTPSGADPAQAKMMMFMPIMMLVLFYNFAAGLVLYWSTNQVLMIAQQLTMQRKKARASAAAAG